MKWNQVNGLSKKKYNRVIRGKEGYGAEKELQQMAKKQNDGEGEKRKKNL